MISSTLMAESNLVYLENIYRLDSRVEREIWLRVDYSRCGRLANQKKLKPFACEEPNVQSEMLMKIDTKILSANFSFFGEPDLGISLNEPRKLLPRRSLEIDITSLTVKGRR